MILFHPGVILTLSEVGLKIYVKWLGVFNTTPLPKIIVKNPICYFQIGYVKIVKVLKFGCVSMIFLGCSGRFMVGLNRLKVLPNT